MNRITVEYTAWGSPYTMHLAIDTPLHKLLEYAACMEKDNNNATFICYIERRHHTGVRP